MATAFPLEAAAIISIIVESVLYGFSLFMFGITIWALKSKHPISRTSILLGMVASLLFVLSTMHVILDARRVYVGFMSYDDPSVYFSEVTQNTFKNVVYGFETLIADAVIIYRCYILWQSIWIVIPLILGWCAVGVTGAYAVWSIAQPVTSPDDIFVTEMAQWIVSFYSIAMSTNLVATGLLAYKIWIVNSSFSQSDRDLAPVLLVVLECGALYSLSLVIMIITYELRTNGAYVAVDIIGQVIPITFYTIIVRAAIARITRQTTSSLLPTLDPSFGHSPNPQSGSRASLELKPVQVQMARFTECESPQTMVTGLPASLDV